MIPVAGIVAAWVLAAAPTHRPVTTPPVERTEPTPAPMRGVEIVEHLDRTLPGDLRFVDDAGREVTLGAYFGRGRPVVLALVYYRCPMLCNLVLDGMTAALREVDLAPGRDFDVVAVSIDPAETPALAAAKKQSYLVSYGREGAGGSWHFLTGRPRAVAELAEAVGFRYRYDPSRGEYAHPAALYVATPDGRLSRYLYGIRHEPRTVRLALVEASAGRIGTSLDHFLLTCYDWDASTGTYAPDAVRLMRVGGVLTLVALGAFLSILWVRDLRRQRSA